jgi:hypothetical protein
LCILTPERDNLELDSVVTGFVEASYWNYYKFQIVTSNNIIINVVQTDRNMDCDVFVKSAEDPTRTSYQFADLSTRAEFNVTITNPSDLEWHIGVFGWTSCSYSLRIFIPGM